MRLGEVCILTNNVVRLADFYKGLLEIDNGSDDEVLRKGTRRSKHVSGVYSR